MRRKTAMRLFGVLIAVVLTTAACASSTTTASGPETEQVFEQVPDLPDPEDDMEATEPMEDDSTEEAVADESHSHDDGLEVDASLPIPAIEIELTESDAEGTFALAVSLDNFTITEENLDGDPVANEGHLHLFLDGERVERFFNVEHQVVVPEGEHLVEVELSANDHRPYLLDGEPIRANATVARAGEPAANADTDTSNAAATITATFADGSIELSGDERIEVPQGEVVVLMVSSDVVEEIHVHGYDHFIDVAPGEEAMFEFTADIPGRFEIEFETSHQFIAELVVS